MGERKLSIIANSHMDPVWLWNRSSGRCNWNTTIKSVVRMLGEFTFLKFTCSASTLYRWIEETDRKMFSDIKHLVQEGRWEIVGGWEVQSDVIISRPQTLLKQAEFGKTYFMDKFGVDVRIAYNVDSFGHSAGLPTILQESGFDYYVYGRSQTMPPLFRWQAESGAQVTALHLHGYGHSAAVSKECFVDRIRNSWERDGQYPLLFIGVGDHGGGLFRHHMEWLLEAAEEFPMQFTTLAEYFAGVDEASLPEFSGELGPVFRGCYSACHQVKEKVASAYFKLNMAESLGAKQEELAPAWRELLFHHFHDILPGTSVREAYERDVFPGLGMVEHTANTIIDRELCRRDAATDTTFMTEGGVQIWNPHPSEAMGIVSFDGFTDPNNVGSEFNVLVSREGEEIPLQMLPPATSYGPCGDGWGRFTAAVAVPPQVDVYLAYGRSDKHFPSIGFDRQQELLSKLSFPVFPDHSRTWGFGLKAFIQDVGEAQLQGVHEYQDGPVCSVLRAEYVYECSRFTMDLVAYADIDEIEIRLRLNWCEQNCCLKMALDHHFAEGQFTTGGCYSIDERLQLKNGSASQWVDGKNESMVAESSELPMIDWCAVSDGDQHTGFYAADLHACDHRRGCLRMTLLRPVLYANHEPFVPNTESGWLDLGRTELKLWYFSHENQELAELPQKAQLRLQNSVTHEVTIHEAGEPYAELCPKATASSTAVDLKICSECVYAFNHGDVEAAFTINQETYNIAAKALRVVCWES